MPHPDIISESGRAIVAHHSVRIIEVFGAIQKIRRDTHLVYTENDHPLVKELLDIQKNLAKLNKLEAYHDALERKDDAYNMFTLGMFDLADKARIEHLDWMGPQTKTLALELGAAGIRFNSILPGWTETERVTELMSFRAKQNGTTVEEEIAKQSKDSPLGRMGAPEEFANAAVFLVSPAASYVTGVMLTVDGGMYKGTM